MFRLVNVATIMRNFMKSILIIIFIISFQLLIYGFFLKPIITTWGASEKEVSMPLAGDDPKLMITSTRAILINAPKPEVWKWLIQLGADRSGFYSYDFIEEAMGYKNRPQNSIKPEFKAIAVGDIIRGSIDEKSSIIPYNFRVLYVKPEETLVLDQWGTFFLESINSQQTRLIIRSQETKNSNFWINVGNYIMVPLHFIMERGTLMGIKAHAEAGENVSFSQTNNIVWFLGIVLSGILIYLLIFLGRGIIQCIVIPAILSVCWLLAFLIFKPIPMYGISLFLIICVTISTIVLTKFHKDHTQPKF